uniref:Uncharacterized protein n=1 Tax=Phaeomonas parva TaxID=124430 RepID=A0A7S1UHS0_9STRA
MAVALGVTSNPDITPSEEQVAITLASLSKYVDVLEAAHFDGNGIGQIREVLEKFHFTHRTKNIWQSEPDDLPAPEREEITFLDVDVDKGKAHGVVERLQAGDLGYCTSWKKRYLHLEPGRLLMFASEKPPNPRKKEKEQPEIWLPLAKGCTETKVAHAATQARFNRTFVLEISCIDFFGMHRTLTLAFQNLSYMKTFEDAIQVAISESSLAYTTTIFRAAQRGDLNRITEILEADERYANAQNAYDCGPLHYAVKNVAHAARDHARGEKGDTLKRLNIAMASIALLLSYGADATARNVNGWTPLDLAIKETEGLPRTRRVLLTLLESSSRKVQDDGVYIEPRMQSELMLDVRKGMGQIVAKLPQERVDVLGRTWIRNKAPRDTQINNKVDFGGNAIDPNNLLGENELTLQRTMRGAGELNYEQQKRWNDENSVTGSLLGLTESARPSTTGGGYGNARPGGGRAKGLMEDDDNVSISAEEFLRWRAGAYRRPKTAPSSAEQDLTVQREQNVAAGKLLVTAYPYLHKQPGRSQVRRSHTERPSRKGKIREKSGLRRTMSQERMDPQQKEELIQRQKQYGEVQERLGLQRMVAEKKKATANVRAEEYTRRKLRSRYGFPWQQDWQLHQNYQEEKKKKGKKSRKGATSGAQPQSKTEGADDPHRRPHTTGGGGRARRGDGHGHHRSGHRGHRSRSAKHHRHHRKQKRRGYARDDESVDTTLTRQLDLAVTAKPILGKIPVREVENEDGGPPTQYVDHISDGRARRIIRYWQTQGRAGLRERLWEGKDDEEDPLAAARKDEQVEEDVKKHDLTEAVRIYTDESGQVPMSHFRTSLGRDGNALNEESLGKITNSLDPKRTGFVQPKVITEKLLTMNTATLKTLPFMKNMDMNYLHQLASMQLGANVEEE